MKAVPMTKPAGAVSSIFDTAHMSTPKAKRAAKCTPPKDVEIQSGVPIPSSVHETRRNDPYGDLLRRMADGDMVALQPAQARSLRSKAKKLGIEVTLRTDGELTRVWRVGLIAGSKP